MPTLTVTGELDPFLHVRLQKGEKIICESGAMVMMDATLDLKGKLTGGIGAAVMRRLANEESLFHQHIEAVRGEGDCLLAPNLPGGMQVMAVGPNQYCIGDGAFVAATADVQLQLRTQSIGNALFAQSGGFFITETAGAGQLVVTGLGTLFTLNIEPGKDAIIDNAHVVCWDKRLHYEVSVTTQNTSGGIGGMLGNLVNSATSGEGVVLRFSGAGSVVICSRNKSAFNVAAASS